ncbi:MAG: transglutaminase family protein [Hellea sp.]|nr:transglutaminase family protein [Hellea sp.]
MRLFVSHKTQYDFAIAPHYGLQQLRLTPKSRLGHTVEDWIVDIDGGKVEAEFTDFNNNFTQLVRLHEGVYSLKITCQGNLDITANDGVLGAHEGFTPLWYFSRSTELTMPGPHIQNLLKPFSTDPDNPLDSLHKLSAHIVARVAYRLGSTGPDTTADMAAGLSQGVCQDHAHIFISCARELGFPARYVSGYLMMDDREEQDATHAWAEAWVEGLGWVGFDVSNQISPNEKYVRIASGLDYSEAAPISGVTYGDTGETVKVELRVQQQ